MQKLNSDEESIHYIDTYNQNIEAYILDILINNIPKHVAWDMTIFVELLQHLNCCEDGAFVVCAHFTHLHHLPQ